MNMKVLDFFFHDGKGVLDLEHNGERYRFMDLSITPPKAAGCEQRLEKLDDAWEFQLIAANGEKVWYLYIPDQWSWRNKA